MVLTVSFEGFAESAQRVAHTKEVYVTAHGTKSLVTAADPAKNVSIAAICELAPAECCLKLKEMGLEPHQGTWAENLSPLEINDHGVDFYIGAVSYRSGRGKPGVWVDVFPTQPNMQTVLRAIYEEFRDTGEIPEITFEEFLRDASPSAVVVSPGEIATYLANKENCQ